MIIPFEQKRTPRRGPDSYGKTHRDREYEQRIRVREQVPEHRRDRV